MDQTISWPTNNITLFVKSINKVLPKWNITFTNMADTVAKKGRDFWKLSDIYQWPLQVWSSNSCLLINFQFRVFACVIWFNLGSTNLIIGNKIISRTLWHVNWFNVEISIKTSSFFLKIKVRWRLFRVISGQTAFSKKTRHYKIQIVYCYYLRWRRVYQEWIRNHIDVVNRAYCG